LESEIKRMIGVNCDRYNRTCAKSTPCIVHNTSLWSKELS